jgi:hypothetical protein
VSDLAALVLDGDLDTLFRADGAEERMRRRFWAAVEPRLEQLARDTRVMWEHIKLLAIIDPERLPRDDWEATPHGLVATRMERDADRRGWEAIFALTHPDLETQLAITKMHMILYRERGG